jgi:hypothetical protein
MSSVHFPQHDEAWVRRLIQAEVASAQAEPLNPEVDQSLRGSLRRALALAPQVIKRLPVRDTKPPMWKRFRRWLRSRERERISKFLAPQREFNTALVRALIGHVQSTERQLLSIEENLRRCSQELSLLRQRLADCEEAEEENSQRGVLNSE